MPGQQIDPSYLHLAWSVLTALVVSLLALGNLRAKLATKEDLAKAEEALLHRLYREDGTTIYMPRVECRDSQTSCGKRLCAKLDEIKADSQRRHEEGLEAQREHLRRHDDLGEFVGAVRQFMQHHNKEG